MINPRELRIGNLGYSPTWDKIMTWGPTNPDHPHYSWSCPDDGLILSESQDKIQPIPLTPEWLERAGFYWSIYHQNYHYGDPALMEFYDLAEAYPSGYQLCTFKRRQIIGNKTILYVHELQNAIYTLYGEELTMKKDNHEYSRQIRRDNE